MRLLFLLFCLPVWAQVSVSGVFNYPNGTPVNGSATIALTRPTVTNTCTSPVRVQSLRAVTVKITNGTLGTLTLLPTACMSPQQAYTVRVLDQNNDILYSGYWSVPNSGSVNVTAIDCNLNPGLNGCPKL